MSHAFKFIIDQWIFIDGHSHGLQIICGHFEISNRQSVIVNSIIVWYILYKYIPKILLNQNRERNTKYVVNE